MIVFLKIATLISMIIICVLFFVILIKIGKPSISADLKLNEFVQREINDTLKKRGVLASYKKEMSRQGIMYRAGDYNLNPSWYIMARVAIGVIITFIIWGLFQNILLAVLGVPLGYIAAGLYFKLQNDADNKDIMMDIYNTYAHLKIQTGTGIYIVETLEYVFQNASNERYKEALGELIANFSDKTIPTSTAIEIFKGRFSSKEINKLCVLLQNYVLYGSQASYGKDMMKELQGIIAANTQEAEKEIEDRMEKIGFLFFVIIVLVVGYALLSSFGNINFSF